MQGILQAFTVRSYMDFYLLLTELATCMTIKPISSGTLHPNLCYLLYKVSYNKIINTQVRHSKTHIVYLFLQYMEAGLKRLFRHP